MRGKDFERDIGSKHSRITPAYAGKSSSLRDFLSMARDHPRICGEKRIYRNITGNMEGSPPHMRGKDFSDLFKVGFAGITPAYAGKSASGR